MTDDNAESELVSRLPIIEDQPLSERAEAYRALHDDLSARLEQAPEA
ncbi:hypothetical protein [Microbacterium sp. G2-8]|nr:hypothetical protein [Microbacterium sp. G2-8]